MSVNKKDLAPLAFPKLPPQDLVREYLFSKTINNVTKKYPAWDQPRNETAAELVSKVRDLHKTKLKLDDKKREAVRRRNELDGLWKDLEEKELSLRENFVKFNSFVKENREKRERAERKISDETSLIKKRNEDIAELRINYDNMHNIKTHMDQHIKAHRMYEDYLRDVVIKFPSFKNLEGILDRYETLADARNELGERQKNDLEALELAKSEMLRLVEDKQLVIMGLINILGNLQDRYETAKSKALQWETTVTKIKEHLVIRLNEIHEVKQSSWSIYLQLCKRKEILPDIDREDVENQLLFIKTTMTELSRIIKAAKRRATKDSFSMKSETPSTRR